MIVAGGDDERHQDGEREPEDGEQHEQRDRERDRLALEQVLLEDRVEIGLDRRRPADERLRSGGPADGLAHAGRRLLRLRELERRADRAEDDVAPRRLERLRAAAFDGCRASRRAPPRVRPSSPGPPSRPRWKTTRNEPSSRWPNRSASRERTSSESVPGVVNSFESSLLRPELSAPPVSSTAAHSPTKSQRCRSTNLVQPSIPREVLPAGRPSPRSSGRLAPLHRRGVARRPRTRRRRRTRVPPRAAGGSVESAPRVESYVAG